MVLPRGEWTLPSKKRAEKKERDQARHARPRPLAWDIRKRDSSRWTRVAWLCCGMFSRVLISDCAAVASSSSQWAVPL